MCRSEGCGKFSLYSYFMLLAVVAFAQIVIISVALFNSYTIRYFSEPFRTSIYSSYCIPIVIGDVAYFGYYLVSNKKYAYLKLFSILLFVTFLLNISFSAWSYIEMKELPQLCSNKLETSFKSNTTSEWWRTMETELECCGIHGPNDYRTINQSIPFSCCTSKENPSGCQNLHQTGCLWPLVNTMEYEFILVGCMLLTSAFIQLPGIICSWMLMKNLG